MSRTTRRCGHIVTGTVTRSVLSQHPRMTRALVSWWTGTRRPDAFGYYSETDTIKGRISSLEASAEKPAALKMTMIASIIAALTLPEYLIIS
jgi:hypothetical protein